MKKNILIALFIALINTIYAQVSSLCGEVEYIQSTHFSVDFSRRFKLVFNSNISLYKEMNVRANKSTVSRKQEEKGIQLNVDVSRNNIRPEFFYNDKQHFYYMQIFFDEEFVIKDPNLSFEWLLETETKQIGRFVCQKATTHFRGRDYTAWFCPEIPVTFGPWKFRGLSGLILEIYDKDNVFHIVAKDIQIQETENCNIAVDTSKFTTAMTIPQFLKKRKKLHREYTMRIYSKILPKGTPMPDLEEDCDDCEQEKIEIFKQ